MANGVDFEHIPIYIRRDEFVPVSQKVEKLVIDQAVLGTQFINLNEDVAEMKNYLQSIDTKISNLMKAAMRIGWSIIALAASILTTHPQFLKLLTSWISQ